MTHHHVGGTVLPHTVSLGTPHHIKDFCSLFWPRAARHGGGRALSRAARGVGPENLPSVGQQALQCSKILRACLYGGANGACAAKAATPETFRGVAPPLRRPLFRGVHNYAQE